MKAFKLFRVRRDGSLGPVIINRGQRVPVGKWLKCEDHSDKARSYGVAVRVGFHATKEAHAPHLTNGSKQAITDNRTWFVVELRKVRAEHRGVDGGSDWYVAEQMRVLHPA
jgi:hypothetical protein